MGATSLSPRRLSLVGRCCTAAETPARARGSTYSPLEGTRTMTPVCLCPPAPLSDPAPVSVTCFSLSSRIFLGSQHLPPPRWWSCPSNPVSPQGDTGHSLSPHLSPARTGQPACRVSPSPSPFLRKFHQKRAAFCGAEIEWEPRGLAPQNQSWEPQNWGLEPQKKAESPRDWGLAPLKQSQEPQNWGLGPQNRAGSCGIRVWHTSKGARSPMAWVWNPKNRAGSHGVGV